VAKSTKATGKKAGKAPGKKPTGGAASGRAVPPAGGEPPELEIGPPPAEDPQSQAEYFMQLLDAFAEQGTAEAKRLRAALIEAVDEYSQKAKDGRDEAMRILQAKLLGMEAGLVELLLRSTRKMRDRFVLESRKLGQSSQMGKAIHAAAEGMGQITEALQKLLDAAGAGSDELRTEAYAMMQRARKTLEVLRR